MEDSREAVVRFLEEKSGAAGALEAVLRVDESTAEWTFDDVPVDSGLFGEIVSRGVVEHHGDGYRLRDPGAVREVLAEDPGPDRGATGGFGSRRPALPPLDSLTKLPSPRAVGVATALAALVVLPRVLYFGSVFRRGDVVLPTNDPYYYRYLVETYVATGGGLSEVGGGSVLYVATFGTLSQLAGGTAHAAGLVLAWYPVVVALFVSGLLYLATARLTGNRTLGVVVAVMLALTPGYALRTALGYADHHAFDYLWLALTMASVVVLRSDRRRESRYERFAFVLALGVGVGAQVLSWRGGILILAPLGAVVGALTLDDVRRGRSPLRSNVTVLAGFGVGVGIVLLAHSALGWLSSALVAAPLLVFAGSFGLVAVAEVAHRTRPSVPAVVAADAALVAVGATAFLLLAGEGNVLDQGFAYFSRTLDSGVAETLSLGVFSGPLFYFGLVPFFIALPALAYATWRTYRDSHPGFLVFVVYAWYFLALAFVQRRFVGELSIPLALFVGMAFVFLAGWIDVLPAVDVFDGTNLETLRVDGDVIRSNGVHLLLLFLLVSGLSLVQIPVNVQKVTVDPQQHDAARYVDGFAEERGLTYPENHVLSEWGVNRMYNYYVSHLSVPALRYSYARTNFEPFLASPTPYRWYEEFDGRVGFVVITDEDQRDRFSEGSAYVRLYDHYGSDHGNVPGLSHYRAIYVSADESIKVFQVVDGATISGTHDGETVTLATEARLEDRTVPYERQVATGPSGNFSVTVPYPGQYEVGDRSVRVSEEDVLNGTTIAV